MTLPPSVLAKIRDEASEHTYNESVFPEEQNEYIYDAFTAGAKLGWELAMNIKTGNCETCAECIKLDGDSVHCKNYFKTVKKPEYCCNWQPKESEEV